MTGFKEKRGGAATRGRRWRVAFPVEEWRRGRIRRPASEALRQHGSTATVEVERDRVATTVWLRTGLSGWGGRSALYDMGARSSAAVARGAWWIRSSNAWAPAWKAETGTGGTLRQNYFRIKNTSETD
jgi:hypothetical protein